MAGRGACLRIHHRGVVAGHAGRCPAPRAAAARLGEPAAALRGAMPAATDRAAAGDRVRAARAAPRGRRGIARQHRGVAVIAEGATSETISRAVPSSWIGTIAGVSRWTGPNCAVCRIASMPTCRFGCARAGCVLDLLVAQVEAADLDRLSGLESTSLDPCAIDERARLAREVDEPNDAGRRRPRSSRGGATPTDPAAASRRPARDRA